MKEGWARGYRLDAERASRGQQRVGNLAAGDALRAQSLDLRPLSPAAVRAVIRPFLAAGWDVQGLVHAIDHTPTGPGAPSPTARSPPRTAVADSSGGAVVDVAERCRRGVRAETPTRPVTFPAAWLTWRLAAWADQSVPTAARYQGSRSASAP